MGTGGIVAIVVVALLVIIGAATVGAFVIFHLWMPPVAALVGLVAIYPLWGWRRLAAVSAYMVDELDRLRVENPELPVIMCSAYTEHGARSTLEALGRGAVDYVTKPSGQRDFAAAMESLAQLHREGTPA